MTDLAIIVLIKSYVGDVEVPQALVDELWGYWQDAYNDGYREGYDVAYYETSEEE